MDSQKTRTVLPLPVLSPEPVLTNFPQHQCVYLPDRPAEFRAFAASGISPDAYHALMNAGFRRSGRVIYQPACPACSACVPLRVAAADFSPSKSQRRCFRKNSDLIVSVAAPEATDEKYAVYLDYQTHWHNKQQSDYEGFISFLYESPVETLEFTYRDQAGRLLGVGICDVCTESVSSVYFYFSPAMAKRGLGTFSALYEIEFARRKGIPHWYAGFHVAGCDAMEYKKMFRPHELLSFEGVWRRAD